MHRWMNVRTLRRSAVLAIPLLLNGNVALAQRSQSDVALELLRRMDANRDGQLDPSEIPARSQASVRRLAEQAGLDPGGGPLPIDRLERQLRGDSGRPPRGERGSPDERGPRGERGRGGRGRDEPGRPPEGRGRRGGRGESTPGDAVSREPADAPATGTAPRGFGPSPANGVASSSSSGPQGFGAVGAAEGQLEERFDERIVQYVDRFLSQYDRNRNGQLDSNEWEGIRWGDNPKDSDQNGDGVLTRAELAERMASRWGSRGGNRDSGDRRPPDRSGADRSGADRAPPDRSARGRGFRGGPPESSPSPSSSGGGNDRVRRYAEGLLKRYDESGNGVLEKAEWSKMRSRYASADANQDGLITVDELAGQLSEFSGGSSGGSSRGGTAQGNSRGPNGRGRSAGSSRASNRKSYRFLTPAERLRESMSGRIRDAFLDLDQDGDGQVAMSEFATTWTDEKVEEFAALDANRDGLVTPAEYSEAKSD